MKFLKKKQITIISLISVLIIPTLGSQELSLDLQTYCDKIIEKEIQCSNEMINKRLEVNQSLLIELDIIKANFEQEATEKIELSKIEILQAQEVLSSQIERELDYPLELLKANVDEMVMRIKEEVQVRIEAQRNIENQEKNMQNSSLDKKPTDEEIAKPEQDISKGEIGTPEKESTKEEGIESDKDLLEEEVNISQEINKEEVSELDRDLLEEEVGIPQDLVKEQISEKEESILEKTAEEEIFESEETLLENREEILEMKSPELEEN